MNNDVFFIERQQFRQWWLWAILIGINSVTLVAAFIFKKVIDEQQTGDKSTGNIALLLTLGLTILLTGLFISLRLETLIKEDGIYVKFFPFHSSFKRYEWSVVSRSFVREYNPVTEYGGWGLRSGIFGNGKAYNVSGNKGLQLDFTDNKKLLIGTKKPDELKEALEKIGHLKP